MTDAISTVVLSAWLDGLELSTGERTSLLAELEISEAIIEQWDLLVDRGIELRLVRRAVELRGPLVGLRAAQALPRGAFSVCEYLMRTAESFDDALDFLIRHQSILGTPPIFKTTRDGGLHLQLARSYDPTSVVESVIAEFALASVVHVGQLATVGGWAPRGVWFRHAGRHRAIYRETFGCDVHFGAKVSELVIPRTALSLPMRDADARLRALIGRCHGIGIDGEATGSRAAEVRRFVSARLTTGAPSLRDAARALNLPARTLQNQLRAEGVNYRELVSDVRRALAERYLAEDRLTTPEITLLLGYSEVSAFHRAFSRWTGRTPSEYRAAARARAHRPTLGPSA